MALDIKKLRGVKEEPGGKIIAQCPACAEEGGDTSECNHLIIYPDGRFGCVLYPGSEGSDHRKEIFRLVGLRDDERPLKVPRAIQIRRRSRTK